MADLRAHAALATNRNHAPTTDMFTNEYADLVHGACVGLELDERDRIFFSETGSAKEARERFCDTCPVRELCLQMALENNDGYGVFGGLTPKQRRRLALDGSA